MSDSATNQETIYEKFVKQDMQIRDLARGITNRECHTDLPNQSEEIDQLAKSFCKAQYEYKPIELNKSSNRGPYANLIAYFVAIREAFKNNGLSFYHYSTFINKIEYLRARVMHEESGQWIESHALLNQNDDIKQYSSDKTKHKRYIMRDVLGIISDDSDDDDSNNSAPKAKYSNGTGKISEGQINYIRRLIGDSADEEKELLIKYKVDKIEDLDKSHASEIIDGLK